MTSLSSIQPSPVHSGLGGASLRSQKVTRCCFRDLIPVLLSLMLFLICLSVTIVMNKCMQQTRRLAAWEACFLAVAENTAKFSEKAVERSVKNPQILKKCFLSNKLIRNCLICICFWKLDMSASNVYFTLLGALVSLPLHTFENVPFPGGRTQIQDMKQIATNKITSLSLCVLWITLSQYSSPLRSSSL